MANEPTNTNETNVESKGTESKSTADLEARIKELEAENGKLKQATTNASADASRHKKEAAEWKDKYNSRLSDEEKAKEDQANATAAMQEELENLRKERNIAKFTASLAASDIGMDAETAKAVAEALNAGETEQVFDGLRRFITAHDKALREDALRNNRTLPGGSTTKTITKEDFAKMSYTEMLALKREHPDQFAEFTK